MLTFYSIEMKNKNGFNIMLFVCITNLILALSCTKIYKTENKGILMKTDRDFSAMSVSEGMHKAFISFIADSGIMLRDNAYPIMSRNELAKIFEKSSDSTFSLSWEPVFEKISGSGDLGYTIGIYSRKNRGTGEISRGNYVTIWERQKDGSWKFVLDSGTQGLPE